MQAIKRVYHTGMVVADLDVAMVTLADALDVAWAKPIETRGVMHTPQGPGPWDSRCTYSIGGPHHIELCEHLPGSAWDRATGGSATNHLGLWADDLDAESQRLESLGIKRELYGIRDGYDGAVRFSYHRYPGSSLWIELIDASRRPELLRWFDPENAPEA